MKRIPRTRPWIVLSFLIDWIIIVALSAGTYSISILEPHYREFSLTDTSLMYTHAHDELVPFWLLAVLCFLIIPVLIICITLVMATPQELNRGLLGLGLSIGLCTIIVESLKYVIIGRPRPDMLSRCHPPIDAYNPPFGLSNYTICTTAPHNSVLMDGFKSFPSGHAAYSFVSFTYFSLYLAGVLQLFNQNGDGRGLKSILFCTPIAGALFISASRFENYRHHWSDLLIGGIIGVICAIFGYGQYHASLFKSDYSSTRRNSKSRQGDEAQNDNNQHRGYPASENPSAMA